MEVVPTFEAHPDRELVGASSRTTPSTEPLAQERSFLSGQIDLHGF
jgi:hypothetical protein